MKFWIPYIIAIVVGILLGVGILELLKYFYPDESVSWLTSTSLCLSMSSISINTVTLIKSIKLNKKLDRRRKRK